MDIGCGRGEWLGLLNDLDITAIGIDTNPVQIADVQDMGLDARHGDARSALSEAKDNSLACITAHHLIEHLPFEDVLWIAREAMRVLAPGGLLLFETPNVRNVLVGATSFHNDPTHLHPMTDPVLNVLFETVGFHPIETRQLHPHEKLAEFMAKPGFDPELANLMFGAQDLAILGHKPLQGA
jgi:O-antigen chain-terminating methyltransferase